MNKVVSLDAFRVRTGTNEGTAASATLYSDVPLRAAWVDKSKESMHGVSSGSIDAPKLYEKHAGQTGRFFEISSNLVALLDQCISQMNDKDLFSADDSLMRCIPLFEEMFLMDELGDSVSLVAMKSLQACKSTVIIDSPDLPFAIKKSILNVRKSPFMKFEEACKLADEISKSANFKLKLPGYDDISSTLLSSGA
jgi:hypothetical protein